MSETDRLVTGIKEIMKQCHDPGTCHALHNLINPGPLEGIYEVKLNAEDTNKEGLIFIDSRRFKLVR